MKLKISLLLATAIAANLPAQTTAPAPAAPAAIAPVATPPPAELTTPPPAKAEKKPAKKKAPAPKKPALVEPPIVLVPGAATIKGRNINVRGQASFRGEVITHLNDGDAINVIEQVILEKPKADEPSQWAKIVYPAGGFVWVHSSYIDTTNNVVSVKKLNLRAGPGENHSIVGLVERGTPIKQVESKNNWVKIEAPTNAYAFVAAMFVKQEGTAPALPPIVSVMPETTAVPETAPVVPANPEAAATNAAAEPTPVIASAETNAPVPPPVEELPPRIISHEGVVRTAWHVQSPTAFRLVATDTGDTINYLYTTSTNLDLARYKGLRIVVTGEEGLDERWKATPVITIRRIQVVE